MFGIIFFLNSHLNHYKFKPINEYILKPSSTPSCREKNSLQSCVFRFYIRLSWVYSKSFLPYRIII